MVYSLSKKTSLVKHPINSFYVKLLTDKPGVKRNLIGEGRPNYTESQDWGDSISCILGYTN